MVCICFRCFCCIYIYNYDLTLQEIDGGTGRLRGDSRHQGDSKLLETEGGPEYIPILQARKRLVVVVVAIFVADIWCGWVVVAADVDAVVASAYVVDDDDDNDDAILR